MAAEGSGAVTTILATVISAAISVCVALISYNSAKNNLGSYSRAALPV